MSELAERLRDLRAQSGVVPPRPRSPIPEELRRMLGVRVRAMVPRMPTPALDRLVPGEQIAPGLLFTESLHDWPEAPAFLDAAFGGMGAIGRDRLLAFDTETTGLAGGTGTRAFMIGVADWRRGRLRIRQLTTTTLGAEAAMLAAFAQWLHEDTVLVSYNGKSYDAPLLNTRYRLARQPSPLPKLAHLDLLHPVRRRWRGDWENCRLATAERKLLGVVREDDLPGSEAPRAWLDFLRGGSARDLRRVATHNAQDLRSLMGIFLRLATLDSGTAPCPRTSLPLCSSSASPDRDRPG